MGHRWIIDVLADLKSFAQANDMVLLADQLEQTTTVAAAEITSNSAGMPLAAVRSDDKQAGPVYSEVRSSKCA